MTTSHKLLCLALCWQPQRAPSSYFNALLHFQITEDGKTTVTHFPGNSKNSLMHQKVLKTSCPQGLHILCYAISYSLSPSNPSKSYQVQLLPSHLNYYSYSFSTTSFIGNFPSSQLRTASQDGEYCTWRTKEK